MPSLLILLPPCRLWKAIAVFCALTLVVSARGQSQMIVNGGFETLPFPSGWTSTSAVSVAGFSGSAAAARLPYNTMATLNQTAAAASTAFTFDVSFSIAGNTTTQALTLVLATDAGPTVALRTAVGGILQVQVEGTWVPVTRLSDSATFAAAINQAVRLRVIGRDFGTAGARFDLAWSDPGQSSLTHAAAGLAAFVMPAAAVSGGIRTVRFDRAAAADNSFTVDDVSLLNAAAAPPVSDYGVTLPPVPEPDKVVNISGVYPHLAMANTHDECGVGAVVPWAGKLWAITYGPHLPTGSTDKLYEIAPDLSRVIRPESTGGTPANRFIHTPSNQLIIGPHFIDASGHVRTLSYASAPGRYTATAAHLSDPANRVYIFTMEDGLYDVNVNDLTFVTRYPDVQGSGDGFLAGYHGKGAYSSQGLLAAGNNGEPNQTMPSGVLATWNGSVQGNGTMTAWTQVERIQTCEVTGPGGIYGNPNPASDPLWTTGFDAKSVILHTFENGIWNTWRLPKASYTHDGAHGWHTEWPRIRQLDPSDPNSIYLMHMHGLFYKFPRTFSSANFSGLTPISSYYKMPVDYCLFNGRLVMGKNDTTKFSNALVPKAESNLWFGQLSDLNKWGAPTGHGAVWMNEAVAAGQASDPFLVSGFPQGTLHLRNLGIAPVDVEIQTSAGTPAWSSLRMITVPAGGYVFELINSLGVPWVRLRAVNASANLTAFFHLHSPYPHTTPASAGTDEFAALADIRDTRSYSDGLIRVMNTADLKFEMASSRADGTGNTVAHRYHQIGGSMVLSDVTDPAAATALRSAAATTKDFGSDAASAWVTEGANRFRLPKLDPLYDSPFPSGWARGFREVVTERQILNCHGTFYEVPRAISGGYRKMRALVTHGKRISDFASWRGLFVLAGVLDSAPVSDKLVKNPDGTAALWLGEIDDLWRMGEPRGVGGPWMGSVVSAGLPSDPYLMYGYDRKELRLSHGFPSAVTFTVEVDFLGDNSWSTYRSLAVQPGQTLVHVFPTGFHAHWVRLISDTATTASAQFTYGPAASRDAFLDWARGFGLATGTGRTGLFPADPDSDGVNTLAEFYLGSSPVDASSKELPAVVADSGEGPLDFRYPHNTEADGVAAVVQTSATLDSGSWTDRPELPPDVISAAPETARERLRVLVPQGPEGRLFLRLRIYPDQSIPSSPIPPP